MPVLIRPATFEDWDGYRAAFESVAAEGRWIGTELPIDWEARRPGFEASVTQPERLVLLAVTDDGEIVGWAHSEHSPSGQATLGMGIVDGHRSAGLGTRLLTGVIDWARQQGAHKVVLEVWPHNTRAIGLYEKLGFVIEARHRRHWRRRDGSLWDSVMMGLVLDEDSPGGPPPSDG
jgi:RimJ/RimL family protein N-acetyltransferase